MQRPGNTSPAHHRIARARRRPALPLLALLALPGCQSLLTETTSAAAGIGGASIAAGVGANAAATTGIGLGVQALSRIALEMLS